MEQIEHKHGLFFIHSVLSVGQRQHAISWLGDKRDQFIFTCRRDSNRTLDADGRDAGLNRSSQLFDIYKLFGYVLVDLCSRQFGIVDSISSSGTPTPLDPDNIIITHDVHKTMISQLCRMVAQLDETLEIACSLLVHSGSLPAFKTTDEFNELLTRA